MTLPRTLVALASLGFASATAEAGTCGAYNQKPCTIWERIPSCDSGLYEDFSKNKCLRHTRPSTCGRLNQVPCKIWEYLPSCDGNLVEDFRQNKCVTPLTCGALNQRPCQIHERIPSCNDGLAEDFIQNKCVQPVPIAMACTAAFDFTEDTMEAAAGRIATETTSLSQYLQAHPEAAEAFKQAAAQLRDRHAPEIARMRDLALELIAPGGAQERNALTDHARLCQGVTGTVEDLSERVQRKLYYMLTTGTVTVSATADADAIAGLAIQEGIAMSYSGDGVKFGLQMSAQGQLVTDVDIAAGVDITWSPGTQLPTTLELDDMIEVYASIGVGVGPELLVESEFGVDIIFAIPTTSQPITVEWLMSRFSGISVTASVAASALPLQGSGTVAAGVQMSVPFTPTEAERIPPPPGELYPGLKAYGGDYAGPTVSQQGDVVTLGGLVKRTESSWPEALFILPEDRRPTKRLVFPANQHDGRARIDILPDGRVLVVSTGSRDYVSLDGISPRKTAGTAMPLGPSVNPYGGDYEGPSMSVVGDIVRLQGLAKRTNNDWSVIGTLPAAYRPARRIAFEALSHDHDIRVDIKPDGQVIWNTGNESSPWISLSGIELVKTGVGTETTSTRRPFPVGPGVEAYTHAEYRSPQIEKSGGVVRLSGFVKRTGSTWPKIGTLPAGYRPSARRIFHLNTNDGFARVDVLPNGDVLVVHGGTAYPMIALSGIRFEAN